MQADIELLTVDELAAILKLSKQAVYSLVHRREIPCIKIGRRVRFEQSSINAFLADQRVDVKND